MNKILLGAVVCATVAGIVYYAVNPEKFHETLEDLKSKADDAIGKVKEGFDKQHQDMASRMS